MTARDTPPDRLDELVSNLYTTLRGIANRLLGRPEGRRSISASDLLHDCYLKLARAHAGDGLSRTEFVALASRALRNVLVDRARAIRAMKRGGRHERVTLEAVESYAPDQELDLLDLDLALQKLGQLDERQARVVELRFFGGLTHEEIAAVLECSPRTVNKEWAMAKAWLHRELTRD